MSPQIQSNAHLSFKQIVIFLFPFHSAKAKRGKVGEIMEKEYLAMLIIPVSKTMVKREKEDRVFFVVHPLSITLMAMISTALL